MRDAATEPWMSTYVTGENLSVSPSGPRSPAPWGWFVAWLAAGSGCALAVLGALTVGIFILPIAAATIVVLASRRGAIDGIAGLISGLGLPLVYVAYLNRDGPGEICKVRTNGSSCTQESSPWLWLLFGMAFVVVGVVVFVRSGRSRAIPPG